jgi:hypothetical protein
MAPAGFAYVVTTTLQANCTLSSSNPTLVAVASPEAQVLPAGDRSATIDASGSKSATSDPTATSYYRLWDPVGLLLNASYTTINWSTSGGTIASASSSIQAIWAYDAWINTGLSDNWNGGCVGCSSISAKGYAAFLWAAEPSYYNQDWNYITADGNGGYSNCYSSWNWLTGFPGWHTQVWCG